MSYLLTVDQYNWQGVAEGSSYLQFDDRQTAEDFARQLATDYFHCGPLPETGAFATATLKGDVERYDDLFIINWTEQSPAHEDSVGDSYFLIVIPLQAYAPGDRLDFWNKRTSPFSLN